MFHHQCNKSCCGEKVLVTNLCIYSIHTSNTTRSIYYIVRFQDFTLRSILGLPAVRGTDGIQYVLGEYFTRVCCSISRFHTLDILLSRRHNWPSVVLLIYSQYSLCYALQ